MKRLVLIGAGHGHLAVLRALAAQTLAPDIEVVLINPDLYQTYSGMLPGWMMGYYTLEQCQIRLEPWIKRAKLTFIQDSVIGIDANTQVIHLKQHPALIYDWLSINTGSQIQLGAWANEQVMPIRPLNGFIQYWTQLIEQPPPVLTVIGGGAAGVELAFAARERLPQTSVHLIANNLLAGHSQRVIKNTESLLKQRAIHLHYTKVDSVKGNTLHLTHPYHLDSQAIIAASGAQAPTWLKTSNLALASDGFIQVNTYQQSISHPNVLAIGDISARPDIQRSGVHAVKGGTVLAHNIMQILTQHNPQLLPYKPRQRSLYLLACGQYQAILSWGRWSTYGRWVWRWKNKIDTDFMNQWL
ncbi:MAG: FAD-dependent oxidoreductase [Thiofilum sp.]|uniref:FAD-dependent oxidoreductase n=1 Tax=Thiofilum sp. TaxID=2212733 RepID=UPI0025FC168D|nr:FAD-dependent oxidoreductase [Thiofilum sp.]MBK8454865.1 FAD-dependent oxidoreductase [Thiofilum sp.]